jgi:hypothetical protein
VSGRLRGRAGLGARSTGCDLETTEPSEQRVWLWLAVLVLCVSMLFHGGDIGWSDGMSMYQVARSIVEDGDVAIELGVVWEGADGRYYSPFGIGLSLVALPVYAFVRLLRVAMPVPEQFAQGLVSFLSTLILALLAAAVYRLARRLGSSNGLAAGVGLGAALGTFAIVYGKAFWSEPLAALLITVAIERALARAPLAAGLASAAAALTRPQLFLFAPIVLWALWRQGGPVWRLAHLHHSRSQGPPRLDTTSSAGGIPSTWGIRGPRCRRDSRRRSWKAFAACSCTQRRACCCSPRSSS